MTLDTKRRNLLIGAPALLAASMAGDATSSAAGIPTRTSETPGDWSAVTYQPPVLQRQLATNTKLLLDKDYRSFFLPDLEVPTAEARLLLQGSLSPDQVLKPSVADLNRLLDPSYRPVKRGYAILEGPTLYLQSQTFFPGSNTDMLKWWFVWHPIERERYMLWFPYAHVNNSVVDPKRLGDKNLSYEQRLYDNPNSVTEFIGTTQIDIVINFKDPVELGFDKAAYEKAGFSASASGLVGPAISPNYVNSLMLHLGRNVEGGMELFNRYWIGPHPDLSRFPGSEKGIVQRAMDWIIPAMNEDAAYEFAVHDMIEFHHLAKILPDLYGKFGPL